jgi:hypothetical protein
LKRCAGQQQHTLKVKSRLLIKKNWVKPFKTIVMEIIPLLLLLLLSKCILYIFYMIKKHQTLYSGVVNITHADGLLLPAFLISAPTIEKKTIK